ncbi:hypothetical protein D3C73_780730 [compost metagenome]
MSRCGIGLRKYQTEPWVPPVYAPWERKSVNRMGIIGYRTKYPKKGSLKKRRFRPLFGSMNLKTHLKKILNKDHSITKKRGRIKIAILIRPLLLFIAHRLFWPCSLISASSTRNTCFWSSSGITDISMILPSVAESSSVSVFVQKSYLSVVKMPYARR